MKVKEFGSVTVYTHEIKEHDTKDKVEINWKGFGSVSLSLTQKFNNDLLDAMIYAGEEEIRIGAK